MDLMKENLPGGWTSQDIGGLDLLLKAAHKSTEPKQAPVRKPRVPSMVLSGSYKSAVIVGRGSQATLNLGRVNKQVSRRHAIVQWCADANEFQITVLGQNGVRINGVGFPSGQQATLRAGDIVDLVGVKMVFSAPDGPRAETIQPLQDSSLTRKNNNYSSNNSSCNKDSSDGHFSFSTTPSTPKRAEKNHHQSSHLLTPTKSSPTRLNQSSPTHITPTARMRHKLLKYDQSPVAQRTIFHSPPPSSDGATEYGSSPIRSRPSFKLPVGTMPIQSPVFIEAPESFEEPSIFLQGDLPTIDNHIPFAVQPAKNRHVGSLTPKKAHSPIPAPSEDSSKPITTARERSDENRLSKLPTQRTAVNANKVQPTLPSSSPKSQSASAPLSSAAAGAESTNPTSHSVSKVSTPARRITVNMGTSALASQSLRNSTTTISFKDSESVQPTLSAITNISEAAPGQDVPQSDFLKCSHVEAHQSDPTLVTPLKVLTGQSLEQEKDVSSIESSPDVSVSATRVDYTEMIIDTLVFARKKKSMTLTELYDEMVVSQPSLMASQDAAEIKEQLLQSLSAARCVGKITRKGKDAYNKPLENQWYYIPECDHNMMRRQTRQEVMPSARKCTLKDKQYFFKMPPKLPYHRKSASPYAVKPVARRGKDLSKLSAGVTDNGDITSSDPEDQAEEPALANKKRRMINVAVVDKKHKSAMDASVVVEDEDDDAHEDSLDDLSDLSGLSD